MENELNTYAMKQKEEIKSIRKRKISLNLSDADCGRLFDLAGEVGVSISELLENFIEDVVDGTYSNGSDERMYAQQWFQRCGFGMLPENTYLRYLLTHGEVETIVDYWEDRQTSIECLRGRENSPMDDRVDEIEREHLQRDLDEDDRAIQDSWNGFLTWATPKTTYNFNKEMEEVIRFHKNREAFIKEELPQKTPETEQKLTREQLIEEIKSYSKDEEFIVTFDFNNVLNHGEIEEVTRFHESREVFQKEKPPEKAPETEQKLLRKQKKSR